MKKKTHHYMKHFKMPRLFREDLEKIEVIVEEVPSAKYSLETEEFQYDSVNEIGVDCESTNIFNIKINDPYISLNFEEQGATLYASEDDVTSIGAVNKITDIINKRERKLKYYFSKISNWVAPLVAGSSVMLLIEMVNREEYITILYSSLLIVLIVAVIWWVIGYTACNKGFSVVEFDYKRNKSSFISRNKETIIINIIIAITSAIVTLFLTKIFE